MKNTIGVQLLTAALFLFGSAFSDSLQGAKETSQAGYECSHHSSEKTANGNILSNHHFDNLRSGEAWVVKDGRLQSPLVRNKATCFSVGNDTWKDYEFTLQASTIDVGGELLIGVRCSEDQSYTVVLGADGNRCSKLMHTTYHGDKTQAQDRQIDVTPGGIECGRWQRVRIRCENRRLQVWLNTKMLFDIADYDGPLGGSLRIGSKNARSRFRNMKVRTLTGELLYDSLPAPAKCWQAIGQVQISGDSEAKQLQAGTLKIVSPRGRKTGIEQRCISLTETESLCGSIRIKGEVPEGLDVRLFNGDACVSEKHLPAPGDEWEQMSFDLAFEGDLEKGSIQIMTRGKGTVWLDEVILSKKHRCRNDSVRHLAQNIN